MSAIFDRIGKSTFSQQIRRQKIELCVYLLHFQDPKGKKYCDFLAGKLTEIPIKCNSLAQNNYKVIIATMVATCNESLLLPLHYRAKKSSDYRYKLQIIVIVTSLQ